MKMHFAAFILWPIEPKEHSELWSSRDSACTNIAHLNRQQFFCMLLNGNSYLVKGFRSLFCSVCSLISSPTGSCSVLFFGN